MFGINKYLIMGVGGAVLLGGTAYVSYNKGYENGANSVQTKWDAEKIENQQMELEYATALSAALTTIDRQNNLLDKDVSVKYLDKVRVVTETKWRNNEVIREVFKDTPFLSKGWVYAHDRLARGETIDPTLAANREVSEYTESDSLDAISTNYGIAREREIKNENWIDFYNGVKLNYSLPTGSEGASESDDKTTSGSTSSIGTGNEGARSN